MTLRTDVYELLCLYEGDNPREAFKPVWVNPDGIWKKPKECLRYRSQVPDHLEPAYDIALGDGLLEQHVMSDRMDAWVHLTERGRAEIARYEVLPDAKDTPLTNEDIKPRKESLDARALALFLEDKTRRKADIARILKRRTQSLAPSRCPELDKAMRAWKTPRGAGIPRGSKDKDGRIEAEDFDEDD